MVVQKLDNVIYRRQGGHDSNSTQYQWGGDGTAIYGCSKAGQCFSTGENHYPVNNSSGNQLCYPVGVECGRYCHIWAIQECAAVRGMVFKQFTLGIGYINQRVWVQNRVSFSRKLINWLKSLVQTRGTGNCHSKILKNQIGFVLAGLCYCFQKFLENTYCRMKGARTVGK